MDAAHPATLRRAASRPVKVAYGIGAISTGVTQTGFNFFLLIFYAQVIGMDPRLVGLALTISLVFDAISGPLVGVWSDNFRSRWGRRHPFIYAAAIPGAIAYAVLWMPPAGLSGDRLFWYLVAVATIARVIDTFYETPASALLPELSYGYDDRTMLQGLRQFFGWSGGNVLSVLMFTLVFPAFATAAITNGQFNREAYVLYGFIAAGVVAASVLVSAIGTHREIPYLRAAPPARRLGPSAIFRELRETLADRSFGALFLAAILGSIAAGLGTSLTFYFTTFFWGFTPQEVGLITLGVFLSALIGAVLAPWASRRLGKKKGATIIGLIAFLGAPLPIVLRLAGLLPPNDDPAIFWIVAVATTIDTGLIVCFEILTAAMIADLVDAAEVRTGRRSEGVFFSVLAFIRKAVLGLGLLAASLVLTIAAFPPGAKAGEVPADTLWRFGATYVPVIFTLWLLMIAMLGRYRLTRDDHELNLHKLAQARAEPLPII